MRFQVDSDVDEGRVERLRRFHLDSRVVEVADTIDRRHGTDRRYVKIGTATATSTSCTRTKLAPNGS
jgi:hypothetical protein